MQEILDVLEELSFLGERYAVGGCVRDYVMGIEPHDIDVAVKLFPIQVVAEASVRGYQVIPTGIDKGTITILLDSGPVEVTTYRHDVETLGRDVRVAFNAGLHEDMARRDFTMNAMAMDPDGNVIDLFAGQLDIASGYLTAVGVPVDRLREDYLRVIRAFRFAARFQFSIDSELKDAIKEVAPEVVKNVSVERIVAEMTKAFQYPHADVFLQYMYKFGILQEIIPDFEGTDKLGQHPVWHPEGDVWEHVRQVVERAPVQYRWHALLHDIGKRATAAIKPGNDYYSFYGHAGVGAEMIPDIARSLRLSNDLAEEIEATTRYHMHPLDLWRGGEKILTRKTIRRYQVAVGEHLKAVETVVRADRGERDTEENGGLTEEFMQALFTPLEVNEIKPVLMGRHLIKAGWNPGPEFSFCLKAAFEHQIETGEQEVDKLLEVAEKVRRV